MPIRPSFLALLLVPALGAAQTGIGDPTFPDLGNTGYKATHYNLNLKYDPGTNFLRADVTMTAVAHPIASRFSVDFRGFEIKSVELNGTRVPFRREGDKLWVEPAAPIPDNQEFKLETIYQGTPAQASSEALDGLSAGWINYRDGSVTVCEPNLAHTWFPCNDHPLDKATFDFEIETPAGYSALANGIETQSETAAHHVATWHMDKPIQTCMVVVATGRYGTSNQQGPDGLTIHNYFPASEADAYSRSLADDPKFMSFLESRLGPYPWPSYGTLILPQVVSQANQLMSGAAIETVGLPVFGPGSAGPSTLIHEMCHQWMGDCVSITHWEDDIWWVEGFATFAEFMRTEMTGGKAAYEEQVRNMYRNLSNGGWSAPGHLTTAGMFGTAAYQGGCMVFMALRAKLGDEQFFKTVRSFIDHHRYGNATAEDWIAAASEVSGNDMRPFFTAWLYGDHIPALETGGQ